ncbi:MULTISPECIES: hypothetical protein [unclassified Mesorhizobium]|uniref:hypothetical protein n=1 Tax=unclassified Mesorhizobium TaxID=325217 RepID=UPI0003CEC138|nr:MULTISPECIES: hypothetical protein [unclassified Mesorhizobium]ESX23961.1 hypothetical protein X765_28255 [Mesorhizobium sp. LSHC440B00]ESX35612.1 hypothetical protein X764_26610 [Mesorhizobium sp. LSHC440A00]ESX36066.1 hypothetical protein X763_14990 [Mesorhizobium sp. LSHC432A00]ESX66992.1 hypothetical protein X757_30780 [Mesorhizobium sp. LSHC414A00]ESZ75292.1 hypothetical protein X726_18000 [Mesorhizobium sp. L103C105A0]
MWDFEIGRSVSIMIRTWPFIVFRMIVYFGITLAYIVATGSGASVGYGVGHISTDPDGPLSFALWGGIVGIGIVSIALYWIREYILYVVKAGHIAVMVHLIDGRDVPNGQDQIAYAKDVVKERFAEANILFVVDQLVKGAIRAITGLIGGIAAFLPIPGLGGLIAFINTVIRLSLTYVDEIILGYNIRINSSSPFETARQGVVLYAQNGKTMVKNAIWLAVIMWGVSFVIFLLMLAPAAAIMWFIPGQLGGWAFVLAILLAWAFKAAFIEPFAIACLMQVYFKTIEGQVPNAEWDQRLAEGSSKFRELRDKALASFGGSRWTQPAPGV